MKIPKTIKVGGHIYKVHRRDELPNENLAQITYSKNLIEMLSDMEQSQLEASFLHEILHALNLGMPEERVEFLAQGLYQVLKENKLVFDGKEHNDNN